MGQQVSKRVVMPKLKDATKAYESEVAKDVMNDIARKKIIAKAKGQKYIDPTAQTGFKRDTWHQNEGSPMESHQRNFLKDQQGTHEEMPKDLIDFLNDTGPLEREVDKKFTSEKVYDSLLEEEEQRRQQREEIRQRKRTRMPMMENMNLEEGDNMDGMTVERTTNFSRTVKEENVTDIRLSDKELFDLISKLQKQEITVDEYLSQKFDKDVLTENKRSENMELLENVKRYNGIPVLMQDTDRSLVGAPQHNVEALKFLNIRMAPNNVHLTFDTKSGEEQMKNRNLKEAVVVK